MPDLRTRVLARWRVLLSTIVHVAVVPWVIAFCIRRRCSPIVVAYVNAKTPMGMDASQSKRAFFEAIEKRDPALAALYPRSVLVSPSLEIEDREKTVKDFMGQSAIGYPVVAKPDRGSRSFGAYRVEGEAGLKYLLERISNDYLVEEYCEGPIEAGLFFVRSPDAGRPPLYGVAIKRDAYVPGMAPHPQLIPLRTRFLCADETARLTPALQHLIDAFASATPFDMGRLDVRARSLELLLNEPHSMRVLEVNVGFTAADFHVTDLRHPLSMRLRMTIVKWEDALQLGARSYAAAPRPMGLSDGLAKCLRQGFVLRSMHKDMYRSTSK